MDYEEQGGKVTDFSLVLSDWGTSGNESEHYGGTPVYASGNCFNQSGQKDLFAFGQIAAELYLPQSGNLRKIKIQIFNRKYDFELIK